MAQSKQDPRLAVVVHYEDPQAGITRSYHLLFYTNDNTVEMIDAKNHRTFLKRSVYLSLKAADLYKGNSVMIHSRRMTIAEYADEHTRKVFSSKSECTLGIIKPDGYERMGECFRRMHVEGIRVQNLHMVQLSHDEASAFLASHQSQPYYREFVDHLTSHPVVVMHLRGEDCVGRWRKILGPSDPVVAKQEAPTSLRAKYGTSKIANFGYASKDASTAEKEVEFFFGPQSTVIQRNNASLSNCALAVIKPHAVSSGVAGDIIQKIMDEGFEISALMVTHLRFEDAEDFCEVYKGVIPEYNALVDELSMGPCWVLEIRAENAVESFRQFCGPHDPEIAKVLFPQSLRAIWGVSKVQNAIHCTDLPEDGTLEAEFFFRIIALGKLPA